MSEKPNAEKPQAPPALARLQLPEIAGYVVLMCAKCKDDFYVPKKKNANDRDLSIWNSQFRFCARCAQVPRSTQLPQMPKSKNWNPNTWDPVAHDSKLIKP